MSSSHLYDKRILDRNLAKGLVTKKDYEKHVADLADTAANAEYLDPVAELEDELNPSADEPEAAPDSEGDAAAEGDEDEA